MILLVLIFLVLFGIGFYSSIHILQWLLTYLIEQYSVNVVVLSPIEVIANVVQLALLLVFIVSVPALLWALISYARPALYENERRLLGYVPVSLILGILGSLFGWYLAFNAFIPYLYNVSNWLPVQNMWTLGNLSGFVIVNLLSFFVIFQTPLIVILLHRLGILKINNLMGVRKLVALASVVIGAVFTPTPDIVNQLVVAVPFYLLFEVSIQYCRFKEKFQNRPKKIKAPKKVVKNKKKSRKKK